eukprot:Opistho-2@23110
MPIPPQASAFVSPGYGPVQVVPATNPVAPFVAVAPGYVAVPPYPTVAPGQPSFAPAAAAPIGYVAAPAPQMGYVMANGQGPEWAIVGAQGIQTIPVGAPLPAGMQPAQQQAVAKGKGQSLNELSSIQRGIQLQRFAAQPFPEGAALLGGSPTLMSAGLGGLAANGGMGQPQLLPNGAVVLPSPSPQLASQALPAGYMVNGHADYSG